MVTCLRCEYSSLEVFKKKGGCGTEGRGLVGMANGLMVGLDDLVVFFQS